MQSEFTAVDSLEPWDSATSQRLTEIVCLRETGSLLEVSPARIFPSLVKALGWMVQEADSGLNMPASLAKYDHDTQSWRTSERLLTGDLIEYSGALPKSGMMRNGKIYALPMSERRTAGRESGLWLTPSVEDAGRAGSVDQWNQYELNGRTTGARLRNQVASREQWSTPTVNDAKNSLTDSQRGRGTLTANMVERLWPTPKASMRGDCPSERRRNSPDLHSAVKLWPTPRTAGMCGGTGNWNQLKDKCENIEEARKMGAGNGGQLNPTWVEWLMGYPLGWTDLNASVIQ